MSGVQTSEPISQSADAASWWFLYCLTSEPHTSESDSFMAPDWPKYSRPASVSVTPCPSSWPITSSEPVITPSTSPSPSPNTMRWPSQKAFG